MQDVISQLLGEAAPSVPADPIAAFRAGEVASIARDLETVNHLLSARLPRVRPAEWTPQMLADFAELRTLVAALERTVRSARRGRRG